MYTEYRPAQVVARWPYILHFLRLSNSFAAAPDVYPTVKLPKIFPQSTSDGNLKIKVASVLPSILGDGNIPPRANPRTPHYAAKLVN